MKAQMKAVMASAVVIVLALAAVSGVTYSWFSDTEQAEVQITAGDIKLSIDETTFGVKSYGEDVYTSPASGDNSVTTALGGTVTANTINNADDMILNLTFDGIAPGDSVKINVGTITVTNTINVMYNETYSVEILGDTNSALEAPFIVSGLIGETSISKQQTDAGTTINAHDITIDFPTDVDGKYMGASYKISIMFNAYQANADTPISGGTATTTTVQAGQPVDVTIATSGNNAVASVGIKVGDNSNVQSQNLTISDSAMQSDDAYTLRQNTTVLAGIEVTSSLGENALQGIPTTITFSLKGNYDSSNLTIYHGTAVFNGQQTKSYDVQKNITTVSVTTSDGFSPYFVTCEGIVAVSENGVFESLEAAIDNGGTITLLKDVSEGMISVESNSKISLNGFNIVANLSNLADNSSSYVFHVGKGITLEIDGPGNIIATACKTMSHVSAIIINGAGNVIINGGEYTVYAGTYGDGYLIPTIVDNNSTLGASNLTINGGKFNFERNMFRNFSNNSIEAATITINGGTFSGDGPNSVEDDEGAIWNQKPSSSVPEGAGVVIINGGTFDDVIVDNEFNSGVTVIEGVEITVKGPTSS